MVKAQLRLFSTLLFGVLISLQANLSYATEWDLLNPDKGKRALLEIGGKKRSYWMLDRTNSVVYNVSGPCELKVYTRMRLGKTKDEGIYSFLVYIDNERQSLIARASEYTKNAVNPKRKTERLTESRKIIFDVPPGNHEYRFELPEETKDVIYLRSLIPNHNNNPVSYIAYLPRSFPEEVRIVVKENEYIYYRCAKNNYIELEVIGPTQVKCISRLEFDFTMRGKKHYRIQVNENSKVVLTDYFNADISGVASYSDPSKTVLGKGDTFFIDVPEGRHRYRVTTPDQDISVIFRFYIPEKDLGNECTNNSTTHALIQW